MANSQRIVKGGRTQFRSDQHYTHAYIRRRKISLRRQRDTSSSNPSQIPADKTAGKFIAGDRDVSQAHGRGTAAGGGTQQLVNSIFDEPREIFVADSADRCRSRKLPRTKPGLSLLSGFLDRAVCAPGWQRAPPSLPACLKASVYVEKLSFFHREKKHGRVWLLQKMFNLSDSSLIKPINK
ncbi:hypothetical protein K0M31_008421 [Melipona bicolor]|uniref:Uncharacterized protein n=1 Tax=Melipona bicolor TaxID=60889 RepID=A0AA40FRL2_9HYME|nr:hypothetical protein K0M31_008421 [Melipona bicolor]